MLLVMLLQMMVIPSVVYSAAITGDAGNLGYAWSVDGSGSAAGPTNGATFSVD